MNIENSEISLIEKVLTEYAVSSTYEPKKPPHVIVEDGVALLSVVGHGASEEDKYMYGIWDTASNELEQIGKEVCRVFNICPQNVFVGTDGLSRTMLGIDIGK